MILLCARRRHKQTTHGLHLQSNPNILDSNSADDGRAHPHHPPLPYDHTTSTITTPYPPDLLSAPIIERNLTSLHHLKPAQLVLPVTSANISSSSSSQNEMGINKHSPVILAPSPPSPPVALQNEASARSTHQPTRSNSLGHALDTQLTDEQLELVSRLSNDNVPPADIARLVQKMRGGCGMQSFNMSDISAQGTAPPSYDFM